MSYRFKGESIEIDGNVFQIKPSSTPSNPNDGVMYIDSNDKKLRIYNSDNGRWVVVGDAEDQHFDNSSNGFSASNTQDAIEEAKNASKKFIYLQYQELDTMDYDSYLFAGVKHRGNLQTRSNESSNGYKYGDAAPWLCPFVGKIKKANFVIKGVAVSTGSVELTVTVNFEVWKVGLNGEGTKLGDLNVNIDSSTYTVGKWWDASKQTDFTGSETYNIDVNENDLIAIKFKRIQNSSNSVAVRNPTIVLTIEED